MNQVIQAIIDRRTTRRFAPQQITSEELQQILNAGFYAPTGGGRQSPLMLVCQNPELNTKLGKLNRAFFGKANSDGIHFVSPTQKSIADDDSIQSAFYDAPTVVTLFAPKRWLYSIHDCTSTAITMSLAAWSLGIGSCYVSRAEETFSTELGQKLQAQANISGDYIARVHLCLGYPSCDLGAGKPRKEGRIRYI